MFGYNRPNLKELLGFPYLAWVIALATVRLAPEGAWRELATFGYYAVCINIAIVPSVFLVKQFQEQMYSNESTDTLKSQAQQTEERPTRADPELIPRVMAGGMLVHNLINETVSINAVKAFNQDLVTQHIGGLPVKMTENYWTKKEDGMEQTRWVRIGGTGPTDWKDMMARGLAWGAYGTEGGQDKRVIKSIRKVSQLAQGYPLPTWNQLKKM